MLKEDFIIESSLDLTTILNAEWDMEAASRFVTSTIKLYAKKIASEYKEATDIDAARWMRDKMIENLNKNLKQTFKDI